MNSFLVRWLAMLSPWLLIASLGYAAVFVKLEASETVLEQPLLEKRDRFFDGAAVDKTMWFVGGDGVLLETSDAGVSWQRQALPDDTNLQSTAVSPSGIRVVVGNNAEVFVGKLGQLGWERYQLPQTDYASKLNQVRFINGSFWVVGEMGGIYQLSSDGLTWKKHSLKQDLSITSISAASNGTLWLSSEYGSLFYSEDQGASWTQVQLSEETLRSVAFFGQEGVAVGNGGQVFYSRDAGANWKKQPTFTSEHLFNVIRNGDVWVAVGDQGQMYTARAAGGQWSRQQPEGMSKSYFMRVLPVDEGLLLIGKNLGLIDNKNNWADWPAGIN